MPAVRVPYEKDSSTYFVPAGEIFLPLRAEGHYSIVYIASGRGLFAPGRFRRPRSVCRRSSCGSHRSYLVNTARVAGFQRRKDNGFLSPRRQPVPRPRPRRTLTYPGIARRSGLGVRAGCKVAALCRPGMEVFYGGLPDNYGVRQPSGPRKGSASMGRHITITDRNRQGTKWTNGQTLHRFLVEDMSGSISASGWWVTRRSSSVRSSFFLPSTGG